MMKKKKVEIAQFQALKLRVIGEPIFVKSNCKSSIFAPLLFVNVSNSSIQKFALFTFQSNHQYFEIFAGQDLLHHQSFVVVDFGSTVLGYTAETFLNLGQCTGKVREDW
jgi:hypothetical protein